MLMNDHDSLSAACGRAADGMDGQAVCVFSPACSHREKKQTSWRVRERNAKKFSLKVSKRGFLPDKRT